MNRNEITVRFAELTDQMEQVNTSLKTKRFYAIQEYRNGKLFDFGMYDGVRKKYVICNVSATDAENALSEIQSMVNQS